MWTLEQGLDHRDGKYRTYFLRMAEDRVICIGDHVSLDEAKRSCLMYLGYGWAYEGNGVFQNDSTAPASWAMLLMLPRDSNEDHVDVA